MDRSSQPRFDGWVAVKTPYDASIRAGGEICVRSRLADVLLNGKYFATVSSEEVKYKCSQSTVFRIQPYDETYVLAGPTPSKSPPIRYRLFIAGDMNPLPVCGPEHYQFRNSDGDRTRDEEPLIMERLCFRANPQRVGGLASFPRGVLIAPIATVAAPFENDHYIVMMQVALPEWGAIGDELIPGYQVVYNDGAGTVQAALDIPGTWFSALSVLTGLRSHHTLEVAVEFIRPIVEIAITASGLPLPALEVRWSKLPIEQLSYSNFQSYPLVKRRVLI